LKHYLKPYTVNWVYCVVPKPIKLDIRKEMDWSKLEVDLIVADYFNMLQKELSHTHYNKTQQRQALLPLLNGRSEGSIEFKHQNISAALAKMGLPYIKGYKPRANLQGLLEEVVANYVHEHFIILEPLFRKFAEEIPVKETYKTVDYRKAISDAPTTSEVKESKSIYRAVKINFIELEQNNRLLGEKGEEYVVEYERWRLISEGKEALANSIEWVSKEKGDGLGYDILSKNTDGSDRYIEVKTTKLTKETPFFVSRREVNFASDHAAFFYFFRVFDFGDNTHFFIKQGRYEDFCQLKPVTFKGYI
jgi:hypothetical protein